MDANKAVELGFADEIMTRAKAEPEEGADEGEEEKKPPATSSMLFSRRAVNNTLFNKMAAKYGETKPKIEEQAQIPAPETETGRSVDALMERLHLLRH